MERDHCCCFFCCKDEIQVTYVLHVWKYSAASQCNVILSFVCLSQKKAGLKFLIEVQLFERVFFEVLLFDE